MELPLDAGVADRADPAPPAQPRSGRARSPPRPGARARDRGPGRRVRGCADRIRRGRGHAGPRRRRAVPGSRRPRRPRRASQQRRTGLRAGRRLTAPDREALRELAEDPPSPPPPGSASRRIAGDGYTAEIGPQDDPDMNIVSRLRLDGRELATVIAEVHSLFADA